MTHFKWLKKEIPRWVKEEIITREAGDSLISLYRNEQRHSHGEGLFVLAAVCFLTGLIFICAGVWNGLSQDEQFMMALVPLVLSILIIAAILWQDRPVMDRIPAESVRLEEAENTAELLSEETGGTASTVNGIGENRIEESTAAGNKGKDLYSLLPSVPYRHRVPDVIREAAGVFHSVSVLCAVWMVNESFKLSGDWFVLAAVSCVFLLLMSWAFPTAGLGMVYMASSVLVYRLSPYRGWPEAAAWVFLVLALPLLVRLLGERRHKAVVCYSWFWAVCVLLLIYWTASNLLWQTMFFALAAALTWMAGSMLSSWGAAAEALRLFGGAAVFGVLLEGSWSSVWKGVSGNWILWVLFFVILAIDAVLLTRMGIKRDRLAALGGLTPFVMLVAASLAVFETTGVSSAIFVSIFTAFLAVAVIGRGYRSDSNLLKWVGGCLLAAAGAVRVLDAALSFGQRGIFFLVIGAAAVIVCCLTFLPHAVKKIRRKPGRKTVRRDRQPAAPADQSAFLSELPERKTEEGGERRE